jgi:hypothetical protein
MALKTVLSTAAVLVLWGPVFPASARDLSERYTPEHPYRALNEFGVIPSVEENAILEVYAKPGASGPKYFCAGAEFAKRFLRASPADRLVILRPEATSTTRPGATSVLFNIVPRASSQDLPRTGVTINPRRAGENRSVNAGLSFCDPPDRRRQDD